MENTANIRKRIQKKYCQILLLYIGIISSAVIGWYHLYVYLTITRICLLRWFLIILILGEIALSGLVGKIQVLIFMFRTHNTYGEIDNYPVHHIICIVVTVILWIIHLVVYLTFGIKPSKFLITVLGIFLNIIFALIILTVFFFIYDRVTNFYCVYLCSKKLDDYDLIIQDYNQNIDSYNCMNREIEEIGKFLHKNIPMKYIDKIDENPKLDISDIRIFSLDYKLETYRLEIDRIGKKLEKIADKKQYIDMQLNKKEKLLYELKRTIKYVESPKFSESVQNIFLDIIERIYDKFLK